MYERGFRDGGEGGEVRGGGALKVRTRGAAHGEGGLQRCQGSFLHIERVVTAFYARTTAVVLGMAKRLFAACKLVQCNLCPDDKVCTTIVAFSCTIVHTMAYV